MRKLTLVPILAVLFVLLAACGQTATPAPDTSGQVNITLSTSPAPAMMGDVELILTVTGADGKPVDGATVDVSADHTDMTGMSMSGVATGQGSGRYAIQTNFSMSGNWKLTVYVRKEGLDYKGEIDLSIQ